MSAPFASFRRDNTAPTGATIDPAFPEISENAAENTPVFDIFPQDPGDSAWRYQILNNAKFKLQSDRGPVGHVLRSATGVLTSGFAESLTIRIFDRWNQFEDRVVSVGVLASGGGDVAPTYVGTGTINISSSIVGRTEIGRISPTNSPSPASLTGLSITAGNSTDFEVEAQGAEIVIFVKSTANLPALIGTPQNLTIGWTHVAGSGSIQRTINVAEAAFLTTFTFRNTSGTSKTWLPVRIPLCFAKGVVTSSEKVVIYNAEDAEAFAQIDQISTWNDGSIKFCVARAWVPSIAANGTYQFRIKKATGSRVQTPIHTPADIANGWNIKAQFSQFRDRNGNLIGSGTYEAALNDTIQDSRYARQYAGGPVALCIKSWARTKDVVGGAERRHYPTWFYTEIWRRPSDNKDVLCVMANPRSSPWLFLSTKNGGGAHYCQPRLMDGENVLLDRGAPILTFTDADIDTELNCITKTDHGLVDGMVVRLDSPDPPGSLESGQYYLVRTGAGGSSDNAQANNRFRLFFQSGIGRYGAAGVMNAANDTVTNTALGHACRTGQPIGSGNNSAAGVPAGQYFARVIDENSITLHPTPADARANTNKIDITANGNFAVPSGFLSGESILTPAGSGTHTLYLASGAHQRSSYFLADEDGDEIWVGISKPTLVPELTDAELAYQIQSGIIPPVDRTLAATVNKIPYIPHRVYPWVPNINQTGGNDMIGFWPGIMERTLISKSIDGWVSVKTAGLITGHVRRMFYLEEALNNGVEYAVPVTVNNGPNKNGTPYPGMGPPRKDVTTALDAGANSAATDPSIDGLWTESTGNDASHWPMAAGSAYVLTGCYWFADLHALTPVRHFMYPNGYREDIINGVTYYNRIFRGPYQDRGKGWLLRDCGYAQVLPDDMPERAPILDAIKDNMFRWNYDFQNVLSQAERNFCYILKPAQTAAVLSHFFLKYMQAGAMAALHLSDLKSTYPDLLSHFIGMMKRLCDPAGNGLIFGNADAAAQYNCFVGNGPAFTNDFYLWLDGNSAVTFNSDHTCTKAANHPPLTNGDKLIVGGPTYTEAGGNPPPGVNTLTIYYIGDVGVGGANQFKLYTDQARTNQLTWGGASAANVRCAVQIQTTARYANGGYDEISLGLLCLAKVYGEPGLDAAIAGARATMNALGPSGANDRKWQYRI